MAVFVLIEFDNGYRGQFGGNLIGVYKDVAPAKREAAKQFRKHCKDEPSGVAQGRKLKWGKHDDGNYETVMDDILTEIIYTISKEKVRTK